MLSGSETTARHFEDVVEGSELPSLVKEITSVQMMMYGAATWDFMRIHYDTDYARERGFDQAFVDGQMLGAFLAQQVVDWAGDPRSLRRLRMRYRHLVYPGDTVTCTGHVSRIYTDGNEGFAECEVVAKNQHGEIVAGPSIALITLPRKVSQ